MEALGEIAMAYGSDMSKELSQAERKTLVELLEKVVEAKVLPQGFIPATSDLESGSHRTVRNLPQFPNEVFKKIIVRCRASQTF
jgi:hypothetical protein